MKRLCGGWGAIALLAAAWPSPGQITATSPYSGIVATQLDSAQWLLRAVQDSNDDFTAALNRAAQSGEEPGDWKDAAWKEAQDKVDRGTQALIKLLQSAIRSDKAILDATAIDTVAGNLEALAASIQSQRVTAESLSALVRLMEAQSETALGLPKPVQGRLGQWEATLDRTVEMFESASRACRNRADEYQLALNDRAGHNL